MGKFAGGILPMAAYGFGGAEIVRWKAA